MSTTQFPADRGCHEPLSLAYARPARRIRPSIQVHTIDGSTVVHFLHADVLFAQEDIVELARPLGLLVEAGHTRLVLDFSGVRAVSSDVLGMLAGLYRRLEKAGGSLRVAGTGPALREMLRICRLDRYIAVES